jgi:hypothetical protein
MSDFYAYICTKTTSDPFIPPRSASVEHLSRDVSDAFLAISGGRFEVGRLAFFPVQRSVPNHLLCDGREVSQSSFPELYKYLGDSQGVATDPEFFVLPDYLTALTPAPAADTETATSGTVSTPPPAITPPTYYPEDSEPVYGDSDSGGRRFNPDEDIP